MYSPCNELYEKDVALFSVLDQNDWSGCCCGFGVDGYCDFRHRITTVVERSVTFIFSFFFYL